MQHYGFIPSPQHTTDWQFGGLSGIENREVLRSDGQWDSYLPPLEIQRNDSFDTMSCVTFSALNCLETLLRRKYDEEVNFSDRFTASMSGTTIQGNNFWNVAESIRKDGLVEESHWPFLPFIKFIDDYLEKPPEQVQIEAKRVYERFKISYESVWDTPEKLMDALQYAPIQVAFHAYCPVDTQGIHQRCAGRGNHAVMLYGYVVGQYWKIYDHYERKLKQLAWDTVFYGAYKYDISKITPIAQPPMALKENVLYQLVEGSGGFILMAAGKPRFDDTAKLLASWAVRNQGKTEGMVGTLTLKDLAGHQLVNLKGEPVTL